MPSIYVAFSPAMQEWGSDVGISKHVYKVGLTNDDPAIAVQALNDEGHAGQIDWQLAGSRAAEDLDEQAFLTRLGERHKLIDPLYYPKIKGVRGIVKVEQRKVEANLVIKRTMEGRDSKVPKIKPSDVADFLIEGAL